MRAGFVDETRFAKKGKKTAGVQRQYCGASGKIDDCVVTVHLGYVPGGFHALADSEVQLTLFGSLHTDTLDALRALDIDTPLDVLTGLGLGWACSQGSPSGRSARIPWEQGVDGVCSKLAFWLISPDLAGYNRGAREGYT